MVRRLLQISLVALLAAQGAASAQAPEHIREEASVDASWVIPTQTKGRSTWYSIGAFRNQERAAGKDDTWGFFLIGECRRGKQMTMCMGSGPFRPMKQGFEMAPDLSSAHVSLKHKGKLYEAHIEAQGAFDFFWAYEGCMSFDDEGNTEDEGEGQGGGAYRFGTAEGTFAGKELTADDRSEAFLESGVMATQCESWPRYWVDSDGNINGVWRFPNPR